jgi:tRNA(Ile)-lysidine synthase
MNEWLNNNIEHNEYNFTVELNCLNNIPHPSLLIRQILKPDHIDLFEIEKFIHSKTGSILETSIYKVLKNRSELIFQKKTDESTFKEEFIFEDTKHMVDFHVECFTKNSEFKIESNPNIVFFDFDSLKFPIKIRSWRNGDYFYPLGMNHRKLLSDFFINNKIPLFEKEKIKVMVSGEEICWVAGMRIDNRFAITSSTEKIFKISYLKNL